MSAASVILALICLGLGIVFSAVITSWIQPAADGLAKGMGM